MKKHEKTLFADLFGIFTEAAQRVPDVIPDQDTYDCWSCSVGGSWFRAMAENLHRLFIDNTFINERVKEVTLRLLEWYANFLHDEGHDLRLVKVCAVIERVQTAAVAVKWPSSTLMNTSIHATFSRH